MNRLNDSGSNSCTLIISVQNSKGFPVEGAQLKIINRTDSANVVPAKYLQKEKFINYTFPDEQVYPFTDGELLIIINHPLTGIYYQSLETDNLLNSNIVIKEIILPIE